MSLINEALKKAQIRQGETTPPAPITNGPAAIPTQPRKGKTPGGKIVLICVGVALLSAAISTTVILLVVRNEDPAPLPAAAVPAPSPVQPTGQPAAQQTPVINPVSAPAHSPITPVATTPAQTAATPTPIIPASPETALQPNPITPALAVASPIVAVEPAAPAIKLGTRIQGFIDRLRVTSIRISDTGNKAILNDRLFRLNDLVEPSLGLRLTDIQTNQLTFTDETGATYLRHF